MTEDIWLTNGGAPYQGSALVPLVEQEAWMLWARDQKTAVLHFWRHQKAVLLGARDATLLRAKEAAESLCAEGYAVTVRAFGGLAVAIDDGVLNVTLMLPGTPPLDAAFHHLSTLLQEGLSAFAPLVVAEVPGSYCPGRFDLSVAGQKIIGIAQRRVGGIVAVSAFVNVCGQADLREAAVRQYYQLAGAHALPAGSFTPPAVVDGVTGNLNDFVEAPPLSVDDCRQALVQACLQRDYMFKGIATLPAHYLHEAKERLLRGRSIIDCFLP